MVDMSALYREDATEQEQALAYQAMVNTGDAWLTAGSIGRQAMELIQMGTIMLGVEGHSDYYGSYVPARSEILPGTVGSREFVLTENDEDYVKLLESLDK